jgi:uncharacterized repeat protein (TIGR03803 family)
MGRFSYGIFLLCVAVIASPAQTLTTVASFDGTNGAYPSNVTLVQNTDGKLYGTTATHGSDNGIGTIFSISTDGVLIDLFNLNPSTGYQPAAGLLVSTKGGLLGTTTSGGANGFGTVLKTDSDGTLVTLHSFDFTDGARPDGALVEGTAGIFFGTTPLGGANGLGTVFNISSSGAFSPRYSFAGTDGANPNAGLVRAIDGSFWGTTSSGGYLERNAGYGTVFNITSSGKLTTLYKFAWIDGAAPLASLIQASDGNFYGTTAGGGIAPAGGRDGSGTIFKITPQGKLTTLYTFGGADGSDPEGALVEGNDGNFYGTTFSGGVYGTIFVITPAGALTTLHQFSGPDGFNPFGGLVQDTDGSFYGTTYGGGENDLGTVFRLSTGLSPFVKTLPVSGMVGAEVTILGTNLAGVTAVTFNGVPASFTVHPAGGAITTKVPAGATTGTVEVTTQNGTLSSYPVFTVTQ